MNDSLITGFRLSPQQRRLWQLRREVAERADCVIRWDGPLSASTLGAALREVIARQEILRTTYCCPPGASVPLQRIADSVEFELVEEDWRQHTEEWQSQAIARLRTECRQDSWDPEAGPVLQARLLRCGPREHILLLTLPALAADQRTWENLLGELGHCYGKLCGEAPELEDPLQYCDFSEWQNELLSSNESEPGLDFWRTSCQKIQLAGLPFSQDKVGEFTCRRLERELSPEICRLLQQVSQSLEASPECLLLLAWCAVLRRATDRSQVTVGVLADGRRFEELGSGIGPFARYLPLIDSLDPTLDLKQNLNRTVAQLQALLRWQELFTWDLLTEVNPVVGRRNCLPFAFECHKPYVLQIDPGASCALLEAGVCLEPFEVKLCVRLDEPSWKLTYEYDAARVSPDNIERLSAQVEELLAQVVRRPEAAIGSLPIIGSREWQVLMVDFQGSSCTPDPPTPWIEQFDECARKVPDRIALVYEGQQISYAALQRRSGNLAAELAARGVAPEALVALALPRSAEMIVGLLGIMRAGGAYVPLDVSQPALRLASMLEDARPGVLVTTRETLNHLPEQRPPVVLLDELTDTQGSFLQTASELRPENLAYVMFTSGSTGRPKGVGIEHRQLAHYVAAVRERLTLPDAGQFATVSTVAADLGNTMIFPALCCGGSLHVIGKDRSFDARALSEYQQDHGIDCLKIVPSHFKAMCQDVPPVDLLPRSRLVFGGELLDLELIEQLQMRDATCAFFNHYGPTETTIGVLAGSIERLGDSDDGSCNSAPLGSPLGDSQIYLLDEWGNPVPLGVPGEAYIGGANLTRGYLGQPVETAERFIPNPFSARPGTRLYKTGDRCRFLQNARLEFVGRTDHQVKLRGFRIELGEVIAVLTEHPQVRDAVVLVEEMNAADQGLIAYVASSETHDDLEPVLRDYLRERLPDYMLPTGYVVLEALPLTPNGKLNRSALPRWEAVRRSSNSAYVEPRTPVERRVAEIWSEVLRRDQIGVHDDFFDLGGHSLLATQVFARLRKEFPGDLQLRTLFERTSVAELAEEIDQLHAAPTLPPLAKVTRDGKPLPLSFAQQRLWFLDRLKPGDSAYNVPSAVDVEGELCLTTLQQSLQGVTDRHEVLRTVIGIRDGRPEQLIQDSWSGRLSVVDVSGLPASERTACLERLTLKEAVRPFDLTRGPLFRASVVRLAPLTHRILVTRHHIVSDGWSTSVLLRELVELYRSYSDDPHAPSPLPELPCQYADYAAWQRHESQEELLGQELTYWRRQLAGLPSLEMPTDRRRTALAAECGDSFTIQLTSELSSAVVSFARREQTTPFVVLLSAFQLLLSRYSGQNDFAVGSPVAGRLHSELEPLIGCFVNSLVLRADLRGDPSVKQMVGRVREVCLQAFEHQTVPFERLVEELEQIRDLERESLFQVMFALQNNPRAEIQLPSGLNFRLVTQSHQNAKLDLILVVQEDPAGFRASWQFSADLFDRETIELLGQCFQTLLSGMVEQPDARIADLPLVPPQYLPKQQEPLSVKRGHVTADSLVDRFQRQVERRPDAIAVVHGGQQLSYAALEGRSTALANQLVELGVAPGDHVGMCLERSTDMVVTTLAILKSGAAYVPVDPNYPPERREHILRDAKVQAVIGQNTLLRGLVGEDVPILTPGQFPEPSSVSLGDCPRRSLRGQPAYMIYTSGSTGLPKGVLVTHDNVLRLFDRTEDWFAFSERDVWVLFHSIAFDFSVWELWGALLFGGRLVVPPFWETRTPTWFLELLRQERVTVLNQTPSAFYQLDQAVRDEDAGEIADLRYVVFGGEALDLPRLQRWFHYHGSGGPKLINMYGITETTVHVTYRPITRSDVLQERGSLIGQAIPDLQVHVLDDQLRWLPSRVPGEIFVGGAGLALGYHGRPALTAERFLPDPFSTRGGSRLYRSGDVARVTTGDDCEYLGRRDHQVKIRGFRIELGEIEAVLAQHADVSAAVVIAREDQPGDKRLVAYVVPASGGSSLRVAPTATCQRLPAGLYGACRDRGAGCSAVNGARKD